jgi:hypothetical protein
VPVITNSRRFSFRGMVFLSDWPLPPEGGSHTFYSSSGRRSHLLSILSRKTKPQDRTLSN